MKRKQIFLDSVHTPTNNKRKSLADVQHARIGLFPPRKVIAAGFWAHEWMLNTTDVTLETVKDCRCQWVFPVGKYVIRYGASEAATLFQVEILGEDSKTSDGKVAVRARKLKDNSTVGSSCSGTIEEVAVWLRIQSAVGVQAQKLEKDRGRLFKKKGPNGSYSKYNFGHITEWFPRFCSASVKELDLVSPLSNSIMDTVNSTDEILPISDVSFATHADLHYYLPESCRMEDDSLFDDLSSTSYSLFTCNTTIQTMNNLNK